MEYLVNHFKLAGAILVDAVTLAPRALKKTMQVLAREYREAESKKEFIVSMGVTIPTLLGAGAGAGLYTASRLAPHHGAYFATGGMALVAVTTVAALVHQEGFQAFPRLRNLRSRRLQSLQRTAQPG